MTRGESEEKLLSEHESLPKNVVIVETPEARFRIIYGFHDTAQKPEDIGSASAVALEVTGDYSDRDNAERVMKWAVGHEQYKLLVGRLQNEKKPIFLIDMSKGDVILLMQHFLPIAEIVAGYGLLASLAEDSIKERAPGEQKPLTRRTLLRKAAKGVAGAYFLSQLPFQGIFGIGREVDEESMKRSIDRFLVDLEEKTHPETTAILLTLRNDLMAQKLATIAEKLRQQSASARPEIGIVVGAAHVGIERSLQKSAAERKDLIQKLMMTPGLGEAQKRIATIARMDFDQDAGKWIATEISQDPHLAPLAQK